MGTDESLGTKDLEARLADLEARLGRVERDVGAGPSSLRTRIDRLETTLREPPSRAVGRPPEPARPPTAAGLPPSRPATHPAPAVTTGPATVEPAAGAVTPAAAAAAATTPAAAPTTHEPFEPSVPSPSWREPGATPAADQPRPAGWTDRFQDLDVREALARVEEQFTGRALAWIGGVALVVAAVFFLSYGIQAGWINEPVRVAIGLVAGGVGLALGAFFLERRNRLLGHVITPVGLAVITIALVAGTRLYDLFPVPIGLAVALLAAALTAILAVRHDSQVIAAFGLVSVLAAPPLLGAAPDLTTLAFVGVALVGTTTIALWRTWSWLPPVAFLLAAPQAASWLVGESNVTFGLLGLAAFWALNAVAAAGEEVRHPRHDLGPSSATLLLADAAFLVWGGFVLLDGAYEPYRASFLVVAAVAHLALGVGFLLRDGDMSLFGLLVTGTGIAVLTLAAPVGLGAPAVPIAWTAEAVALAWLAARRSHAFSGLVSAVLFLLAAAYLVAFVFPYSAAWDGVAFPGGPLAVGVFVAGLIAGGVIVRDRAVWSAMATLGLAVTGWAVVIGAEAHWVVVGLAALLVTGTAIRRGLPLLAEHRPSWRSDGRLTVPPDVDLGLREAARSLLPIALVAVGAVATAAIVMLSAGGSVDDRPFVHASGAALGVYLAGLAVVGALERSWVTREALAGLGIVVVTWACLFELDDAALVAAWSLLAIAGTSIWRGLRYGAGLERATGGVIPGTAEGPTTTSLPTPPRPPSLAGQLPLPLAAILAATLATAHVVIIELPYTEFGTAALPSVPFSDVGALVAAILAATSVVIGLILGGPVRRRVGILGAGLVVAYLIPYEVPAWAVVVLWSGLGVTGVVASRLDRDDPRAFRAAAAAVIVAAGAVAVGIVAPPTRLVVGDAGLSVEEAVRTAVALGSVALAAGILAWNERTERWAHWLEAATGVAIVYTASIATVDAFATQVGGDVATTDLRTAAQTALSVLWTALGAIAFVIGLWRRRADLRLGGLALLGLAVAKVFLVDLASLELIYRVISLAVLGLLLLVSAGLWQRLRPGGHTPTGRPAH